MEMLVVVVERTGGVVRSYRMARLKQHNRPTEEFVKLRAGLRWTVEAAERKT